MTHAADEFGRQCIDTSDEADAHILLMHLPLFPIEVLRKKPHEKIDLFMRTFPILRRKRIDRQDFQLQVNRRIQDIMQSIYACTMADRAQEALPLRPASIAVHDDSDMAWQARAIDIGRHRFHPSHGRLAKNLLPHNVPLISPWLSILFTFVPQRLHEVIIAWKQNHIHRIF